MNRNKQRKPSLRSSLASLPSVKNPESSPFSQLPPVEFPERHEPRRKRAKNILACASFSASSWPLSIENQNSKIKNDLNPRHSSSPPPAVRLAHSTPSNP